MGFLTELKFAVRALARVKGLSVTVILTLALGIGANAAIFSVVRGVLLRPLVNRDEGSLIYIRQSAPGDNVENAAFSVPEIQDLRARITSVAALGEFSTINFNMVGLGEPRTIRAGVVDGRYFDVMGLRPVLGRLLTSSDDGPNAAGAAVHAAVLDDVARERSECAGQTDSTRRALGYHRRRPRAVGAVSRRDRADRQRRDESASPFRDDGHGT